MTLSDCTNECLFCSVEPDLIIVQNSLAFAIFDGFPVSQGHSLIIPRRHVADYSDLTAKEILAIHQILAEVRSLIQKRFPPMALMSVSILVSPVDRRACMFMFTLFLVIREM